MQNNNDTRNEVKGKIDITTATLKPEVKQYFTIEKNVKNPATYVIALINIPAMLM